MDKILLKVMIYVDMVVDEFASTQACSMANRIKESDPDIDHVYISEERITIGRQSTGMLYHFNMPPHALAFREDFDILKPKHDKGKRIKAKEYPAPFMLTLRESDLSRTEYRWSGIGMARTVIEHDGRESGPRPYRNIPTAA